MATTITIKNLSKHFGKVAAVNNVSLDIEAGAFLTLLGPSGCGKTTLLRCVAGLEDPDGGEIYIGDKLVFSYDKGISLPSGNRDLGLVFQNYALWPHMKVFDNVAFALKLQKRPSDEIKKRVQESLALVGLEELSDRYPFQLSGGQQQRLCLARVLALDPEVILLDEPMSGLDPISTAKIENSLQNLKQHYTIVIVPHNIQQAARVADHAAFFLQGKLIEEGLGTQLFTMPRDQRTEDYVTGRFG